MGCMHRIKSPPTRARCCLLKFRLPTPPACNTQQAMQDCHGGAAAGAAGQRRRRKPAAGRGTTAAASPVMGAGLVDREPARGSGRRRGLVSRAVRAPGNQGGNNRGARGGGGGGGGTDSCRHCPAGGQERPAQDEEEGRWISSLSSKWQPERSSRLSFTWQAWACMDDAPLSGESNASMQRNAAAAMPTQGGPPAPSHERRPTHTHPRPTQGCQSPTQGICATI